MPKYYGMVKCLDDNIGRILETLRKNKQIDNTIIVFTSDHGDLCGEHGRLNKGVPYEGSARIPFLMVCPGKIPAGTVVNEALSCVDFMPTLFALTGDKLPKGVQGRDASALFRGKADKWTTWHSCAPPPTASRGSPPSPIGTSSSTPRLANRGCSTSRPTRRVTKRLRQTGIETNHPEVNQAPGRLR